MSPSSMSGSLTVAARPNAEERAAQGPPARQRLSAPGRAIGSAYIARSTPCSGRVLRGALRTVPGVTDERTSLLASRRLWAGLAVVLVGLIFNLGWFFVPPHVWLDDPGLVPMPEALLGWWVIAIGLALVAWGALRRNRR